MSKLTMRRARIRGYVFLVTSICAMAFEAASIWRVLSCQ
jgi:hypothetical protein